MSARTTTASPMGRLGSSGYYKVIPSRASSPDQGKSRDHEDERIVRARWSVDFLNVCERLISRDEIGVVFDSDGTPFRYVKPESPLADTYNELRSVGYARGWL